MTTPVDEVEEERRLPRQRYVDVVVDTLIVAGAVLGAASALAFDGPADGRALAGRTSAPLLQGVALLAITLLALVARMVLGLRLLRRPVLGSALVSRTIVVCGTAVLLSRQASGPLSVVAAALGAAMLVGEIVAEPYLRRAARFVPPLAANLPGIAPAPRPRDLNLWLVSVSFCAVSAGLLLATAHWSPWWWVVAAAFALVLPAVVAVQGRARILQARRLRTQVPLAVADYAPEFVVYTSRPDDASYQVMMWLPYLQRTGQRFLVITRNRVPAEALAALTDVPVIQARGISDLDGLVPASLHAAFYVNASSGNGAFVRYQHLTHVYLGHGDSDKPPSYNPTHAMYDRIFAAGPAATRRYAAHGVRIVPEKFEIVGRPQVEGVTPAATPVADVAEPVVLYAPTWRGHVEETLLYSLPQGERIVAALLHRGATVVFRPHPFNYDFREDAAVTGRIQAMLAADRSATGRQHLWGAGAESDRGILDCINLSDAMVSDVSAVVSDYVFSGKPFAMIAVPSEPAIFVAEYPVARGAYIVRGDLTDLDPALDQMLGQDPLAAERASIRVDYLGDFPTDRYADAFVQAARQVASRPSGHVAGDDDTEEADAEAAASESDSESDGRSGYRRVLTSVVLNLSSTTVATVSLGSALLAAPRPFTCTLALLALLGAAVSARRAVRRPSRWARLLTFASVTRSVVLMVLAVLAADGAAFSAVVVTVLLLAISLVGETHIRSAWGRLGLEVRGFPAVRAHTHERVPRGVLTVSGTLTLVLALVLVVLDALAWLPAALSVAVLVLYVDALVRSLLRASRVVGAESRLRGTLVERAPQFAVYFASAVGAAYQVGMWLPFFLRIERPFIIVTRTVPMMRAIAAVTQGLGVEVPVIHRPTLRSLEDVIVDSMTAAFYVNNAVRNTHFVERRELTHVWLNHGDSEKPACFNPVHAIYDLLFTAGQAGVDRYARHGITIPVEKFRIVGRPQVESVQPARGPVAEQSTPTVLYAPTWQGPFADSRVYSLPLGKDIVQELLDRGVRVIFRAHPFNYRFPICVTMITEIGRLLAADRATTGREHLWGPAAEQERTIEDCFNASDAMICDVSAVVSDYLHSNKPFAIVSVGRSPETLLKEAPAARAAYLLRQDLSNLKEICSDLLGPDPLAAVREETRIYYLGRFPPEHYADGFLQAAREVIDTPKALHRQAHRETVGGPEPQPELTTHDLED